MFLKDNDDTDYRSEDRDALFLYSFIANIYIYNHANAIESDSNRVSRVTFGFFSNKHLNLYQQSMIIELCP